MSPHIKITFRILVWPNMSLQNNSLRVLLGLSLMNTVIQVILNKLECRGKFNLFQ